MEYKRIEGFTERHHNPFVEFKGKKIAFIAQQSIIDISPVSFPLVAIPGSNRQTVWYTYRLELPQDETKPLEGGVTVMSHEPIFSRDVAVGMAERAAIAEKE